MTGFEKYSTETLLSVRANLLKGLDKVVEHIEAGTLDVSSDPKACPPRAGGQLTVALLSLVDQTLAGRNGRVV